MGAALAGGAVKGQQSWDYLPPAGPGKRHPVRRSLVVLAGAVGVGAVIGWRLGR